MRIKFSQLKHLTVETASGVKIGKIADVVCDTEGQVVLQYIVKQSRFSQNELVVSREQIVRFEEKKMVVDDNVCRNKADKDVTEKKPSAEVGAVAMMNRE